MRLYDILTELDLDTKHFPNPLSRSDNPKWATKGERDGSEKDDIIGVKFTSVPASSIKPTQSEIYLGKATSMAVPGVTPPFDMIFSKENYILDGHHRWLAAGLADPSMKVDGWKVNLDINNLIILLRALGDFWGNKRGTVPSGGDINLYKAKERDMLDIIREGKYTNPSFWNQDKANAWLEKIGGEKEYIKRVKMLQSKRPPSGAPPREQMPRIRPSQTSVMAQLLNKGNIDAFPPYANETVTRFKTKLKEFFKK